MEKVLLKFDYLFAEDLCTTISLVRYGTGLDDIKVLFKNYTDEIFIRAFGVHEKVSVKDLDDFLEDRCFPRERANCKELLDGLGVGNFGYDPLSIIRVTHGIMFTDKFWIRFDGEDITYEEARRSMMLSP